MNPFLDLVLRVRAVAIRQVHAVAQHGRVGPARSSPCRDCLSPGRAPCPLHQGFTPLDARLERTTRFHLARLPAWLATCEAHPTRNTSH
jgi:hypothetical protein